jgi:peptidoglycan/xylan/chitin deacetylase (PgdA/CDA1 family)
MVQASPLLTTSWDDGHQLDLRVADLLNKHGITGTFYVPRHAPAGTLDAAQLRDLSRGFEIGAHTLDHTVLTDAPIERARQEIEGSRLWVEDRTGSRCRMFCPPRGRFSRDHLGIIQRAGFLGLRSVELMSLDPPRAEAGLLIMPTSVQAHAHGPGAYVRNMAKRAAPRNLWLYLLHGRAADWPAMARNLLARVTARGGVFHLWGHSWEIHQAGQWQRLDDALRMMRDCAVQASCRTNGQICERAAEGMRCDARRCSP